MIILSDWLGGAKHSCCGRRMNTFLINPPSVLICWVKSTSICSIIPTPPLLCPPPPPSVPPSPQFSLLSEVRGLVTPQDLECFDGMVLRREIQALKARQGTAGAAAPQPDALSMVSYPDTLTSSSASFMTNTTLSSARVGQSTVDSASQFAALSLFLVQHFSTPLPV